MHLKNLMLVGLKRDVRLIDLLPLGIKDVQAERSCGVGCFRFRG